MMLVALGAASYWALTRSLNDEVDRGKALMGDQRGQLDQPAIIGGVGGGNDQGLFSIGEGKS